MGVDLSMQTSGGVHSALSPGQVSGASQAPLLTRQICSVPRWKELKLEQSGPALLPRVLAHSLLPCHAAISLCNAHLLGFSWNKRVLGAGGRATVAFRILIANLSAWVAHLRHAPRRLVHGTGASSNIWSTHILCTSITAADTNQSQPHRALFQEIIVAGLGFAVAGAVVIAAFANRILAFLQTITQ